MFDVIIQGPTDNDSLEKLYNSFDFNVVNKVIYSDCSNTIHLKKDNLVLLNHVDPGENSGDYKKPLNINRFLAGVKSSLRKVSTGNVLIVRSDIDFSLQLLIAKLDYDKLNVLDVTTKKFWLKEKWKYHFCDWLYFGARSKIELMINNTDYEKLPVTFTDSLHPCSPEYLLMYNYLKNNELLNENIFDCVNVIFSESIDLKSRKKEYKDIPFGVNKVYGLKKSDVENNALSFWRKTVLYSLYLKIKAKIVC